MTLNAQFWTGLALALATGSALAANVATDPRRAELAALLPDWLEQTQTPSVAVALIEDSALAWTLVAGAQAPGVPATERTLYNVASLTKPIFAEVALRWFVANDISIDQPMDQAWVDPDLADSEHLHELSPRLCFSHQCGFANWRRQTEGRLTVQWEPGSQAAYSGEGYEYVRRYLLELAQAPLDELAQQMLFGPAQMRDTAFSQRPWFAERLALPQGPEGEFGSADVSITGNAADDLHTTAGDYARFVVSVMRGEGLSDSLSASRWQVTHDQSAQVCQPGRLEGKLCPRQMGFTLGWLRFDGPEQTVYFHGGGDWGERAFVFFVPKTGFGLVVLTNGANGMSVIRNVASHLQSDPSLNAFLDMQAGS